jgi:hypothetical protein
MEKPQSWRTRWESYVWATRLARLAFPELLETGLSLVRPEPPSSLIRSWFSSIKGLLAFFLGRGPRVYLPKADYILCYHSVSDNVKAPILELASRICANGHRCIVRSYEGSWLWEPSGRSDLTAAWRALEDHPSGIGEAIELAVVSLLASATLLVLCFTDRNLEGLFRDPFRVMLEMARSSRRLRVARLVCKELQPRAVCLTNERYSPGADFALAGGVRTILYLHGNPTSFEMPVLSGEVMVWNEKVGGWLEPFRGPGKAPRLHVCGNSELDLVLASSRLRLTASPRQAPALLFLSQCVDRDFPELWRGSATALEWIRGAAERHPGWRFLLKERNYDDGIRRMAELTGLDKLPNVSIVSRETSFVEVLSRPDVRAAAAFSSSGLFVAAGAGKLALRFVVTPEEHVSVVDDVAVKVFDPRELDELLAAAAATVPSPDVVHFPHRGVAIRRMEEVLRAA